MLQEKFTYIERKSKISVQIINAVYKKGIDKISKANYQRNEWVRRKEISHCVVGKIWTTVEMAAWLSWIFNISNKYIW